MATGKPQSNRTHSRKFAHPGGLRDTGSMSEREAKPLVPQRERRGARGRTCRVCGGAIEHAEVVEPGLCGPCGLRVRLRQLAPQGTQCVTCGERRRRSLTVWAPTGDVVCHTCAFYLMERRPWPDDLAPFAHKMRRERRREPR